MPVLKSGSGLWHHSQVCLCQEHDKSDGQFVLVPKWACTQLEDCALSLEECGCRMLTVSVAAQGVTVANEGVHSVPCSRNNTFDKDNCPVSPTARVN